LTKKFVEMHGGEISVESVAGAGSTFRFSLPLIQVEERQLENETGGAAALG
jgi:signal transduction histidine kinase